MKTFHMEYWEDEGMYFGRIRECPVIFSQAKSLEELTSNLKNAYYRMLEEEQITLNYEVKTMDLELDV